MDINRANSAMLNLRLVFLPYGLPLGALSISGNVRLMLIHFDYGF